MKLKKIVVSLLFLLVTFAVLWGIEEVLKSKVSYSEYDPFFESTTGHDVIFMGTSHMYNGVFPMELWDKYGITSYNWGYSNCTLPVDYYILQELFRESIKPKLVVIDLYGLTDYEWYGNRKHRDNDVEQYHAQFDVLPVNRIKYQMMQDVFDDYEGRWDFMFPFLMYHNRWNNLTKNDFVIEKDPEKGAAMLIGIYENEAYQERQGENNRNIDSVCSEYVKPIVDLCTENEVKVLFIYVPSEYDQDHADIAATVGPWVEEMGADYLNTLYWDGIDKNTDFFDGTHLNYNGGHKYTEYLGKYLQNTYLLVNHKGEEGYERWNTDYQEYEVFKDERLLESD